MRHPTFGGSQGIVAIILFVALLASILMLFLGLTRHFYYSDEFKTLVFSVGGLFAPHIALVIGVIVATPEVRRPRRVGVLSFVISILALLIWSSLVVGRIWLFVFDQGLADTTDDLGSFLTELPQKYGFLITGIVAYFFVKESNPRNKREHD